MSKTPICDKIFNKTTFMHFERALAEWQSVARQLETELADALEKIQKMKVCESCKYNDRDECGEDRCTCPDTIVEKNIMGNIHRRLLCIDFNMKFWEFFE